MKDNDKVIRTRTPTQEPVMPGSKTGSVYRKKLYRKRTIEEVRRGLEFTVGNATDPQEVDRDPATQTVDAAVDTVRYAENRTADTIKAYSKKLKDKPIAEAKKHSEALRSDHVKADSYRVHTDTKKIQKEQIKRAYAKKVHEAEKAARKTGKKTAQTGKKAAKDTAGFIGTTLRKVGAFVARHPVGSLIAIIILIIVLAIMAMVNSAGILFGGITGGSVSATYTAEDADIHAAEADYKAKEAEYQAMVDNVATLYPGYDEYNIDADEIGHDPWSLIAILSVMYADFTEPQVKGTVTSFADAQYTFTTSAVTEVRYRTEERTGYYGVSEYDEDGNVIGMTYESYTYYVQVPYEYKILNVTLENHGLENVINSLGLDADTMELYWYMYQTKGERDYLF